MALELNPILQGVNTVFGLAGAIQADKARSRMLEEIATQRRAALDIIAQQAEDAYRRYQEQLQAGKFDATKALDIAGKASATNLRNAMGESLTSLKNLGYKEGDSPFGTTQRRLSEQALLNEQEQRLRIEQDYANREQQVYNFYNQLKLGQANTMLNQSAQMGGELPQGGNIGRVIESITSMNRPQTNPDNQPVTGKNAITGAQQSMAYTTPEQKVLQTQLTSPKPRKTINVKYP
jgi:hypothetical protein